MLKQVQHDDGLLALPDGMTAKGFRAEAQRSAETVTQRRRDADLNHGQLQKNGFAGWFGISAPSAPSASLRETPFFKLGWM